MQEPQHRPPTIPGATKVPAGKKTPVDNRPVSQKGSITPVKVQKPTSASSGVLPAIGTALAGAAVGAGIAAAAAHVAGEDARKEEENNRESGVSQTANAEGEKMVKIRILMVILEYFLTKNFFLFIQFYNKIISGPITFNFIGCFTNNHNGWRPAWS